MVIATHIILTGYGHWLPNDPRGSRSSRVWSEQLRVLGPPQRRRPQGQVTVSDLRYFHRQAAPLLAYPVLWFGERERRILAEAFGDVITTQRYKCFACSILSNHVHLVMRRNRDSAKTIADRLQSESAPHLRRAIGVSDDHPIWNEESFRVFLDNAPAVRRAIDYVNRNPERSGLPPQDHPFVTPYRGEWS